jgi:hypothetical protein
MGKRRRLPGGQKKKPAGATGPLPFIPMRLILSADDVICLDEAIQKDGGADQQQWNKDTRFMHTSKQNKTSDGREEAVLNSQLSSRNPQLFFERRVS